MHRPLKALLATALFFALTSGAASAATLFSLTGPTENAGSSLTFSLDGIDVTITSSTGWIHRNFNGLGAGGGLDRNRIGSNANNNETLTFSFSESVTLTEGTILDRLGGGETFDILDGSANLLGSYSIASPAGPNAILPANFGLTSDTFVFRHTGGGGIRVASLTVSPVPLPAAGWMMLAGLAAFAGMRRRSKALV